MTREYCTINKEFYDQNKLFMDTLPPLFNNSSKIHSMDHITIGLPDLDRTYPNRFITSISRCVRFPYVDTNTYTLVPIRKAAIPTIGDHGFKPLSVDELLCRTSMVTMNYPDGFFDRNDHMLVQNITTNYTTCGDELSIPRSSKLLLVPPYDINDIISGKVSEGAVASQIVNMIQLVERSSPFSGRLLITSWGFDPNSKKESEIYMNIWRSVLTSRVINNINIHFVMDHDSYFITSDMNISGVFMK